MLFLTMLAALVFASRQDFATFAYLAGASSIYYDPNLAMYYASLFISSLAIGSALVNATHYASQLPAFLPRTKNG